MMLVAPTHWPNVHVLRLDRTGGAAPGNKAFKLRYNLARAKAQGHTRILSFGGAWSNHLHALAAVGAELGLETVGILRGGETPTAMLEDVARWGMHIVPVSRADYRRRGDPAYQRELEREYGPCLVIPEGGANAEGVRGCREIAELVPPGHWDRVVAAVGTGTTLAGLAAGLEDVGELVGVSALRGAGDLEQRVGKLLQSAGCAAQVPWRIEHRFHCGGFGRADARLREFVREFERSGELRLDPVYTAKAFLAIHGLLESGEWSGAERILALHTGGLQGRRGCDWL